MSYEFDLVIIGSGPAGYVGAIRAAQLGLKVAVIEKDKTLGGTCLNVGCIPSKALLESSEHFYEMNKHADSHGLVFDSLKFDVKKMLARKNSIVKELTDGIGYLFEKNKITRINGRGSFVDSHTIKVQQENKENTITANNIMIATGSVPNSLPGLNYDGIKVISSTEALSLPYVPHKMAVVGAGAIGLELGSVWARLGSDVTIIEYSSKIAGPMDESLSKRLMQMLKKQGLNFALNSAVQSATPHKDGVVVAYKDLKKDAISELDVDVLLVAAGRIPYTENLGLENLGIETNERGFIKVDSHYRTKQEHIYAVGDVIPGPMLAHKAEEEAVAVAEIIAGQAGHVNYQTVPSVIYTDPEFASVGKTEQELKAEGRAFKAGSFPFSANGRAKALGKTEGMVKVLADKETDLLLGVHIVGPRASDLIHEAVVVMEFGGSAEDLARSFHAHPTLSEVIREAALNVDKLARQM